MFFRVFLNCVSYSTKTIRGRTQVDCFVGGDINRLFSEPFQATPPWNGTWKHSWAFLQVLFFALTATFSSPIKCKFRNCGSFTAYLLNFRCSHYEFPPFGCPIFAVYISNCRRQFSDHLETMLETLSHKDKIKQGPQRCLGFSMVQLNISILNFQLHIRECEHFRMWQQEHMKKSTLEIQEISKPSSGVLFFRKDGPINWPEADNWYDIWAMNWLSINWSIN